MNYNETQLHQDTYSQISNIRLTKFQNFNVSPLVLQLFLPNYIIFCTLVLPLTSHLNRAYHPGGQLWNYYPGAQSLSQVTATHLKIEHPQIYHK